MNGGAVTRLVFATIMVLALTPTVPAGDLTLESFMKIEGIDPATVAKVKAGEVVRVDLEDATEKEIAGYVMVFVKAPIDELVEKKAIERVFDIELAGLELHELSDPSPEAFAEVGYAADETHELVELLQVEPGTEFNLSSDEIGRFRALAGKIKPADVKKDPAAQKAVMDEYRDVLLARYKAYREGGIPAIADYDHGKKMASPRQELTASFEKRQGLKKEQPAIFDAILNWPDDPVDGMKHRFYCEKQDIQDRPTFMLSHHMGVREPGKYVIGAYRQYYVSQSYNSLSAVAFGFAIEGGTFVAYANRTSTDQLVGAMQAMRHKIGRKRMLDEIEKQWTKIQAEYP